MPIKSGDRPTISVNEVRNSVVDFQDVLDSGELLTGSPTLTVTPATATISNEAVTTAAKTVNGRTVAIGQGVQFKITCTAAGRYTITVTCGTDATPAQTLKVDLELEVKA